MQMSKPKKGFLSLVDDDFWGTGDCSSDKKEEATLKQPGLGGDDDAKGDEGFVSSQSRETLSNTDWSHQHDHYYNQNKNSCDDSGDLSSVKNMDDIINEKDDGVDDGNIDDNDKLSDGNINANDQHDGDDDDDDGDDDDDDDDDDESDDGLNKKRAVYHEIREMEISDEEEKYLKGLGRDSAAHNDVYHVRAFLDGPFDVLDENFFNYYDQVRKGLEESCTSKVVQQLKRPPPTCDQRFRDKSFVVVPHFREPDRRMGRYSKYYYHHNIGPEVYSRKVFVGGLPACVTEEEITMFFSRYGRLHVDWPSKHYVAPKPETNLDSESDSKRRPQHLGYVFLLFERERSVRELVTDCFEEEEGLFINLLNCGGCEAIRVQIRPWLLADAEFLMDINVQVNSKLVAFIGGVPRPLKAVELAHFFEQTYGNVVCVGIDIDNKFKYPRGSGRVAFSNYEAYVQAITDRYIVLDHEDIHKRVEIKPYFFHNQSCEECSSRYHRQHAPFFCPSLECFQYYCESCWHKMHSLPSRFHHMPVIKGV